MSLRRNRRWTTERVRLSEWPGDDAAETLRHDIHPTGRLFDASQAHFLLDDLLQNAERYVGTLLAYVLHGLK